MAGAFENKMITTTILGSTSFDGRPLVNPGVGDKQIVGIGSGLVGTGNGGAEDFVDKDGGPLVGELQEVECFGGIHASDKVDNEPDLSGGDAGESM